MLFLVLSAVILLYLFCLYYYFVNFLLICIIIIIILLFMLWSLKDCMAIVSSYPLDFFSVNNHNIITAGSAVMNY